ncbi:hypothetical protein MA16_Dca003034 [Dendrobium catenatum]|uniref:Uncharacterized protein n=1 Tax=Dendrobium catenatum TaxID=906689 RepID=A0A2I0X9E4_9ASPA|nr:hypothetical protein MA16_Dca003034 [Dendrobium catenatum]
MVVLEVDHGFAYNALGEIDILRCPFYKPDWEYDESVEDYINRILYCLAETTDLQKPKTHWLLIGRSTPFPPSATSPSTKVFVVKGGVTRMEYLSGSHKNVAPCSNVHDTIREEIKTYMNKSIMSKHLAQKLFEDRVDVGSYFVSEHSSRDSSSSRGARGPMDH